MKFSQAGKMAVSAVFSNKLRSFLTMLGIIIGVMAVTLLVSLVQGAETSVTDSLSDLGGNEITVSITDRSKRLTLGEVESYAREDGVAYISPTISGSATAKADNRSSDISVMGITESYNHVQGLDLAGGRSISALDNEYRLNVCIIGDTVAQELFGTSDSSDVLDKTIRISGKDYKVVGLLARKEQTFTGDTNRTVYIPFTNAQRLLSSTSVTSFTVLADSEEDLDSVKAMLKKKLMDKFGDEDSFSVINMADVMDTIHSVMGTLELLLAAIAGISLVVGGIGIMNIMLVSVTERTREIGIRKAIGAQKSDIVVQFMIEALVISLAGGLIGMGISQLVLTLINMAFPSYHFVISGTVAAVAMGFSALVGMIFGIYPAAKAASLRPINALRYE